MTYREPAEHIWIERDEIAVIGMARMGQRMVPHIRPFDLLRSTPLNGNRARASIFEGDSLRWLRNMSPAARLSSPARRIMTAFIYKSAGARRLKAKALSSKWSRARTC